MLCVKWYAFIFTLVRQMASKPLHPLSVMAVNQEVIHATLRPFPVDDHINCASQICLQQMSHYQRGHFSLINRAGNNQVDGKSVNLHCFFPIVLLVSTFSDVKYSQRCSVSLRSGDCELEIHASQQTLVFLWPQVALMHDQAHCPSGK